MTKPRVAITFGVALTALASIASADIKIAHIYPGSGPLGVYGKQSHDGFMLGLEYATDGSMMINGEKIVVIEKDSQANPEMGRSLLEEAYADDEVDLAVGPVSSGVAMAMLPVAEEYEKLLIVEPAVADSITGPDSNRYIFHTGRNSSQDAIANAKAIGRPGVSIAVLAQDYAFGRDGVAAFKAALEGTGADLVHEEYVPTTTTDFTAAGQRLFDALKDEDGEKLIYTIWAGSGNPMSKLQAMNPERYDIGFALAGNILAALPAYKQFPGAEGATYYYYENPNNAINDWLVSEHQKRFDSPPDMFTAGGMSAALAIVNAIESANSTDTEDLIETMEGMSWETPKGTMTFRKEDHQALQPMYHFKVVDDDAYDWARLELVREIPVSEMDVPVGRTNR
ncbi:substrate-binding domain-containing protein [Reinekea blandensis]|uniref:Branched-chain amino acid ABC transporter, periplasmic branched-chain amino acid-binding protein n=1 Tax=Reinekea blandensis MED297 TaxID=314283 RepID=A4BDV6_9GAMM|nr:substrate-binding domain-containing protein [Reinekea blandensis]EAR09715.1 branched-chain amino acid ABC transporter, periplasmic branched-chain amino acid-binding protein [Reinekea blandensis MED297]